MRLADILRRNATEAPARLLYERIVAQARLPVFYERGGVPDSIDGRFELVVLHCFQVLRRLRREGEAAETLRQRLFDWMFADMDASLREIGVGDLGVGRRVKRMAQGFYGRVAAYDRGLDREGPALAEALRRNLYGTVEPAPCLVEAMTAHVRADAALLARQDAADLLRGRVAFGSPDFPAPGGREEAAS